MLHIDRPPHVLDTLGIAAGLAGAEENRRNGSCGGEPTKEREHIAKQPALEEQPHQRSPWRRSSIRAHNMTSMPISVTARRPHLAASRYGTTPTSASCAWPIVS